MNKRLWHSMRISMMMASDKRVAYLRKHKVFGHIGKNSIWRDRLVPLYAERIFLGDNMRCGSNAIIGAGSMLNKDIPSNSVVAGVPAKYICSFDEFIEKRKKESLQ